MIRRNFSILIIHLLILNSCGSYADTCVPAVNLKVGDTVTDCPRVGMSQEKAQEVEQGLKQGQIDAQIVTQQKKLLEMKDLQIQAADGRAETLQKIDEEDRDAAQAYRESSHRQFYYGVGATLLMILLSAKAYSWVK